MPESDELGRAIAEGRVITAKEHFKELRQEDQKAIVLLAKDVHEQLGTIRTSFDELKSSVDQFHAAFGGRKEEGSTLYLRITNIVTILIAVGTLIGVVFFRH